MAETPTKKKIKMTFVKLKDMVSNNNLAFGNCTTENSLITDISLILPSQTLAKVYFYIKFFYILFIIVLYLYFLFEPSQDNFQAQSDETKYMESTLGGLNRLVKEYTYIFVVLATCYTAHAQLSSTRSQEETANHFHDFWGVGSLLQLLVMKWDMDTGPLKKANLETENIFTQFKMKGAYEKTRSELGDAFTELKSSVGILAENSEPMSTQLKTEQDNLLEDSVKKSAIFDWDKIKDLPKVANNLDCIGNIAFSMLISQSLILSIVINLLFIYFGDQFINKFKLDERYPKIKVIFEYRKKFQRFYTIHGIFLIVLTLIINIVFAVNILLINYSS